MKSETQYGNKAENKATVNNRNKRMISDCWYLYSVVYSEFSEPTKVPPVGPK